MENVRIEEPEPRLSNASNKSRPGINAPIQTQFHKNLKTQSMQLRPAQALGLGAISEDSKDKVNFGRTESTEPQPTASRPPLPSYQPEISPLANFMANERAQSMLQP